MREGHPVLRMPQWLLFAHRRFAVLGKAGWKGFSGIYRVGPCRSRIRGEFDRHILFFLFHLASYDDYIP